MHDDGLAEGHCLKCADDATNSTLSSWPDDVIVSSYRECCVVLAKMLAKEGPLPSGEKTFSTLEKALPSVAVALPLRWHTDSHPRMQPGQGVGSHCPT